ncbi:MAG: sortase [Candidatus Andersenbacteria bacterium]
MILGAYTALSYRATVLSFDQVPPVFAAQEEREALPINQLVIPTLDIRLDITPGYIHGGVWSIAKNKVSHLVSSARPSESGNIVMYGHNKRSVLGGLTDIELGAVIELTDASGTLHSYRVEEMHIVTPGQLDLVLPTDQEVLTIFTCTGIFDQNRLVIRATPLV